MYPAAAGYPTQVGAPTTNFTPKPIDRPASALDGLAGRLAAQVSRAWELGYRAQSIADDVFGPAESKNGGVGTGGEPALGRYSALASGLDNLDFALSALSLQIERLSCI